MRVTFFDKKSNQKKFRENAVAFSGGNLLNAKVFLENCIAGFFKSSLFRLRSISCSFKKARNSPRNLNNSGGVNPSASEYK